MAQRILIVEDEERMARFVELELLHEGYEVEKAANGRTGLEMIESGSFDLVLLDVMLPGLNGLEVLRRARKTTDTPVLLLTARDTVMDKVTGLDSGADDYITKPFEIEELLARIRVCLRKLEKRAAAQKLLKWGEVTLDADRHTVSCAGEPVSLTNREFDLLQVLLENRGIVLTRDTLLERVWGYEYLGDTNVVDVYVRYLRAKIDDVYGMKMVQTVRGVGYVIR